MNTTATTSMPWCTAVDSSCTPNMKPPSPFTDSDLNGGFGPALLLGVAAAVVAPIGDLFESLIKRDLGIKDMGSILPGHGGFLDRFDGLLFALPATYYLARVAEIF